MIYIKRYNLCFVRVPKTASTSIAYFLEKHMVKEDGDLSFRGIQSNDPNTINTHMQCQFAIDNGIIPRNTRFFGVVRHPYEKLLSLYLDKVSGLNSPTKKYDISPQHFREVAVDGFIRDTYWHKQLQSSYLEYGNKNIGEWWLYDNLENHLRKFCLDYGLDYTLIPRLRVSINSNKPEHQTKNLVDIFYDDKTRKAVYEYWKKDFDLYERVRNDLY